MNFNEQVYALVRSIPPGSVLSYGRVARLLGVPNGARAVGWALNSLPGDENDVPWQRVVNAQGRISIKTPGGADIQRALLEAEGIAFDDADRIDLDRHLWDPPPFEVEQILRDAAGE